MKPKTLMFVCLAACSAIVAISFLHVALAVSPQELAFRDRLAALKQAALHRDWEHTQIAVKSIVEAVDADEGKGDLAPGSADVAIHIMVIFNDMPKACWRGNADMEMDWHLLIAQCNIALQ